MAKTLIVAGYGPGISHAVAELFGKEGFQLAIVSRTASKLEAAVGALKANGITAQAFPADLGKPEEVREMVDQVRSALGPITALHWNAYGAGGGDALSGDDAGLRNVLDVAVTSLAAAIAAALPDLKAEKGGVLVTNGGLGLFADQVDQMGLAWNAMGLSIANSAKHKLVRMLAHKLPSEGVYIGEVMVLGSVKGTAFDNGTATLEARTIAQKFWDLYTAREDVHAQV